MSQFISPTGYVDLDNDCEYSIDRKSTRSREEVNPKEDLAFYFNTYIVPKYGLSNINVSNVASFMKELEMNWSKLDNNLRGKVMDIMVDGILNKDSLFKRELLQKLGINEKTQNTENIIPSFETFGNSISRFGNSNNNNIIIIIVIVIVIFMLFK